MSDISIVKTKEDEASKSLQVTVPVDRVRQAEDKALKYYRQRARLPGFRQDTPPRGWCASASETPSGRPCWKR